jgi:hypothetical protein
MISQKFMMDGHAPEHMNMRSEREAAIYSHRQIRSASTRRAVCSVQLHRPSPALRAEQNNWADEAGPSLCTLPRSVTVAAISGGSTDRRTSRSSSSLPCGRWAYTTVRADGDRRHERTRAVDKERGR